MSDELAGRAAIPRAQIVDGGDYAQALPGSCFTDRIIMIADRRNGEALAEKEGPLRIVVPGEKRQARWVRQLTGISVKRLQ